MIDNYSKIVYTVEPVSKVGDLIERGAEKYAGWVSEPITSAVIGAFNFVFNGVMTNLPMMLIVGGLICFLLTIVFSNHKPYFWGMALWGISAIVRAMNIELGI